MGAASVERSERGAIAEFGAGGRGSKVGRPLADGERGGGHHPERAVRLAVVVVLAPVLDQDLGLGEAGEQLHREELVADASAEALDVRAFREALGVPKEFRPIRRSRSATRQNLRRTSALIAAPKKRSFTADTGTLIKDVDDALGRSTAQ